MRSRKNVAWSGRPRTDLASKHLPEAKAGNHDRVTFEEVATVLDDRLALRARRRFSTERSSSTYRAQRKGLACSLFTNKLAAGRDKDLVTRGRSRSSSGAPVRRGYSRTVRSLAQPLSSISPPESHPSRADARAKSKVVTGYAGMASTRADHLRTPKRAGHARAAALPRPRARWRAASSRASRGESATQSAAGRPRTRSPWSRPHGVPALP